MMSDTVDRLDAEFAESPMIRATDVPSETEVVQAEQQIGVAFPNDYRQFLLRYGGATVGPYPIFGLRPVELMGVDHWSVLDVTRHYRSDSIPDTNHWAVISEDHAGNPIGVDQNGAIWLHDHDFGGTTLLAKTFEDYIRTWCLKLPSGD